MPYLCVAAVIVLPTYWPLMWCQHNGCERLYKAVVCCRAFTSVMSAHTLRRARPTWIGISWTTRWWVPSSASTAVSPPPARPPYSATCPSITTSRSYPSPWGSNSCSLSRTSRRARTKVCLLAIAVAPVVGVLVCWDAARPPSPYCT